MQRVSRDWNYLTDAVPRAVPIRYSSAAPRTLLRHVRPLLVPPWWELEIVSPRLVLPMPSAGFEGGIEDSLGYDYSGRHAPSASFPSRYCGYLHHAVRHYSVQQRRGKAKEDRWLEKWPAGSIRGYRGYGLDDDKHTCPLCQGVGLVPYGYSSNLRFFDYQPHHRILDKSEDGRFLFERLLCARCQKRWTRVTGLEPDREQRYRWRREKQEQLASPFSRTKEIGLRRGLQVFTVEGLRHTVAGYVADGRAIKDIPYKQRTPPKVEAEVDKRGRIRSSEAIDPEMLVQEMQDELPLLYSQLSEAEDRSGNGRQETEEGCYRRSPIVGD